MKKERLSNFELLRLIAMFLVLTVHADFLSLGAPTHDDLLLHPVNAGTRLVIQALSIVCVNVFVLISGWFSIKPSLRGLSNYIFQCLFFFVGIYISMTLCGKAAFTPGSFFCTATLINSNWFVISYLGLYLLAPILNAFAESAMRKQFIIVLTGFFAFQTFYGWLGHGAAAFFGAGYSTTSFLGLYLLARYARLYGPRWSNRPPFIFINISEPCLAQCRSRRLLFV